MSELEKMFLAQTPNDPQKAMLAAKHSFSVGSYGGEHWPYDGEKENLFDVIFSVPVTSRYPHVFGDSQAVVDALFLKANILTKDGPLKIMANRAGVVCYHVPQAN